MSSQDTARTPITLVTPNLSEPVYSGTGTGQTFLDKLDMRTRLLLAGLSVAVLAVSALVLYFSYLVSPQKLTTALLVTSCSFAPSNTGVEIGTPL